MKAILCIAVFFLASQVAVCDDPPAQTPPPLAERLAQALKGEDRPFALVIQIHIRPGSEAEFEDAAVKAAKASRADEGCLGYDFHRDLEKPGHYTLIERWTGLTAIRKHLEKSHTKQILAVFAALSTPPRTVEILAPLGGKM